MRGLRVGLRESPRHSLSPFRSRRGKGSFVLPNDLRGGRGYGPSYLEEGSFVLIATDLLLSGPSKHDVLGGEEFKSVYSVTPLQRKAQTKSSVSKKD